MSGRLRSFPRNIRKRRAGRSLRRAMISPKAKWWKLFHDRELDLLVSQVSISNQTLKEDEANYREALAADCGGARGAVSDPQSQSFAHPLQPWSLLAASADLGELDAGHLGKGAARHRRERRCRAGQRRRARQRPAFRAVRSDAGLRAVAPRAIRCTICWRTRSNSTNARSIYLRTSTMQARRPNPTSSPPRRNCSRRRRPKSTPASPADRTSMRSRC